MKRFERGGVSPPPQSVLQDRGFSPEETQSAPAARLLKLSHTDKRTNRHGACKRWFPHSTRRARPVRCAPCAGLPPRSVRKDRSMPSSPYSSPPAATGHFRWPAFQSAADAASRRRCRHTRSEEHTSEL